MSPQTSYLTPKLKFWEPYGGHPGAFWGLGCGAGGVPKSEPLFRVFPWEMYFWAQKLGLLALPTFPSFLYSTHLDVGTSVPTKHV